MTREPAEQAEPGSDAELLALEAAAEQARQDARRAAQAVRLARRARGRKADPEAATEPADDDDSPAVSLTKPTDDEPTAVAWVPGSETPAPVVLAEPEPVADEVESDEDEDSADAADDTASARRRPRGVTVLASVVAVLAAVFLVIAIVVHAQSPSTPSAAGARDAALLAARQDIVVLNTLDFADVDGGLQRWLGATTGTLHDQLSQVSDADKQAIAVSKSVTTASVLAAAVTQVDAAKGNATVIASVQIDVKPQSGAATTKRSRFSLTMSKVGETWKIAAVQQVGVTLS